MLLSRPSDREPAYSRIKNDIVARIHRGEWAVEKQLPTEPDLQRLYGGVSRGTVRHALLELEMEGYVRRHQGKGTFVASASPRIQSPLGSILSFSQQAHQVGFEPGTQVLEKALVPMSQAEACFRDGLERPNGGQLVQIRRLRLWNAKPVAVQTTYLPASRCSDLLNEGDEGLASLFRIYQERYGVRLTVAEESLRLEEPSEEDATLLRLNRGALAVVRERVSFDQHGVLFELLRSVDRPDALVYRYQIVQDVTRVQEVPRVARRSGRRAAQESRPAHCRP